MLSTLHFCSNLGVKDDLELFQIPITQFSHEGHHFQEIQPISANYQNNETIEFQIRNTAEHFLDPSSIFLHIRGRVLREDGTVLKPLDAVKDEKDPAEPDQVYPINNFANSLFECCDIFLNDKRISHYEHYTFRSFIDLLTQSNIAQRYTLWPLGYEADLTERPLNGESDNGVGARHLRISHSKEFDLATPLFTDLAQQGKLMINGVNMRINLKQNSDKFRLITGPNEKRGYKIKFSKIWLRARFVKIAPSVAMSIEKTLKSGKKALYALRGVETKHRSILAGREDLVFEDLCPRCIPARITFLFIRTEAFYGDFKMDPLKFENLKMESSCLTIGNRKLEESFNFDKGFYAQAYLTLIRQLGNPWIAFTKEQFKKNCFLIHYVLNPDCAMQNFSPITSENVRFDAKLRQPLENKYTCLIITETPRILEIDAERNITIVEPQAK